MLHAASAEAALVLAVQQPLSLITLDIMLPNMDGWEFLGRIKQMPALAAHPGRDHLDRGGSQQGLRARRRGGHAEADLPAGAVRVARRAGPVSRSREGRTLKVLVVDDDPKAVELIAVRILGLASTVLRAYGGREAIDDRAAGAAGPDRARSDDAGGERLRRRRGAQRAARDGAHSDPGRHRQADHRRGPRQAERLRGGDHGEGRVRPRPLRRRRSGGRCPARTVVA